MLVFEVGVGKTTNKGFREKANESANENATIENSLVNKRMKENAKNLKLRISFAQPRNKKASLHQGERSPLVFTKHGRRKGDKTVNTPRHRNLLRG